MSRVDFFFLSFASSCESVELGFSSGSGVSVDLGLPLAGQSAKLKRTSGIRR
jgi:hypothetical protein